MINAYVKLNRVGSANYDFVRYNGNKLDYFEAENFGIFAFPK